MSVWTELASKLEAGGKVVADKAKDLSQIAALKAQIVSCDNTLLKNYKELGKAYYEAHKDDEAFVYSEFMTAIEEALIKKEDLNSQIAALKAASGETAEVEEAVAEPEEDAVKEAPIEESEAAYDSLFESPVEETEAKAEESEEA